MGIITVAISGINAADNPGPGTGIARSLKQSGQDVRTIGFAYDAMEPGNFMDWIIDKSYIMPWPSCTPEDYLHRLAYVHAQEGIDVIIPALDVEIPLYLKLRPQIAKMGIRILLPDAETFALRDKSKLNDLAPKIGLKVPGTLVMKAPDDLLEAEARFGYPMMVKGPFYEAAKAYTRGDAYKAFYEYAARWGYPIIAQEFVGGEEYNIIGLGDGHGNDMGHVAIKKMLVTKAGKIWTNVSIRNEPIFRAAAAFVKAVKWAGGYELEMIQKAGTSDLYLIEINPRFPAWVYMASGCGVNLPERLVCSLLGLPHRSDSDYAAGKMLIRYTGETIRSMADFSTLAVEGESQRTADRAFPISDPEFPTAGIATTTQPMGNP
jgi:carbamoyl-phosphate synthase large subunit